MSPKRKLDTTKNKRSPLLFLMFGLIFVGLLFISLSSLSEASSTIGDKYFFLKKQLIWLPLGLICFFITSKIKLDIVKKYSLPLYIISLILLALVLIPHFGNTSLGARRWLNLGFIGIQPSEILKFTSILYFSYLFSNAEKRNIKTLVIYLSIPFLLIIAEPNLSTAILVSAIVISIYYLSGGEIISLFLLCASISILSVLLIIVSPYRSARLKTLLNPQTNQTTSYHSNQIILALSSGGLTGKGFANSDQKYKYLPKISTDSILAVIGEETGFIGMFAILYTYVYLINYILKIGQRNCGSYEALLVSGVACWIAYQSLINISAIVAIIPLTGVPLPFVSYGGSSLLTLLSAMGLVYNIDRHTSLNSTSNSETKANNQKNNNYRHSHNSGD